MNNLVIILLFFILFFSIIFFDYRFGFWFSIYLGFSGSILIDYILLIMNEYDLKLFKREKIEVNDKK